MTRHEDIEERLIGALAVVPSEDGLRWLDQRVAGLVAQPAATRPRWVPGRRGLLRPLALVAAFAVATGTVVGAMGLLDRTVEDSSLPGWRTAWDRAEVLDLQQTDNGLTVTLERAYADLNQVLVGFTVEGLEAPTSTVGERGPAIDWVAELRDPTGRTADQWAPSSLSMGADETNLSAVIQTWQGAPAPVAGTWELTVTSIGYSAMTNAGSCGAGDETGDACASAGISGPIEGNWSFEFDLPKPSGTVVASEATATKGEATITLSQLRISPTMVSGRIGLRLADETVAYWGLLDAEVRHDGATYPINMATHIDPEDPHDGPNGDENEFGTIGGSDEAAGEWVVHIPQLSYGTDDPAQTPVELSGPWTLTVTVP
ncbi:MAG: DUF4179 domain-containing protein [Candidatus Limnocylindrales bacterium]